MKWKTYFSPGICITLDVTSHMAPTLSLSLKTKALPNCPTSNFYSLLFSCGCVCRNVQPNCQRCSWCPSSISTDDSSTSASSAYCAPYRWAHPAEPMESPAAGAASTHPQTGSKRKSNHSLGTKTVLSSVMFFRLTSEIMHLILWTNSKIIINLAVWNVVIVVASKILNLFFPVNTCLIWWLSVVINF